MSIKIIGKMGNNLKKFLFVLASSVLICFALFFRVGAITSSGGNFTVTPDSVYINWTGPAYAFINITSNVNESFFLVYNSSTSIGPIYFPSNHYNVGEEYPGFDSTNYSLCFINNMKLFIQNESGEYTNFTVLMNETHSYILNLSAPMFCPPGYYFGMLNVTQNGTNDWANISIYANIPINPQNTFYEPNSTAYAKGILSTNSIIHKYYFNTTLAENLTTLTLRISRHTQDIDVYLFSSDGSLIAKSTEKGSDEDEINVNLTPNSLWSFWIWGNVSTNQSYRANMYFSKINVTDTNNPEQKITSLDFGLLTPENHQSSEKNITLVNIDTRELKGVKEKKEIFRVERFNDKNTIGNYSFYVPYYATKIKAKIEWKGGTRWFLSLYDVNGNFIDNSSQKYIPGNFTNTVQEEVVLYTGAINENNDGFWKLTVGNLSQINSNDYYNITIYIWQNASEILMSNYPLNGFNFTSFGSENASKNVSLNITLPLPKIVNGTYEGFVDYYVPSEWNVRIPISFTVKAGNLLFNYTPKTYDVSLKDNIGFDRLGNNVLQITIPFSNNGDQPIYFENQTSNNILKLDDTHNMSFIVEWPQNPISPGYSGNLKINISINSSIANQTGVYRGWIFFNTTNTSNASSSSYPFENYNITLSMNLTDLLIVNVTEILPLFVNNVSYQNNISVNITVTLMNGTVLSSISNLLNESEGNFYGFYLIETNTSREIALQNITKSGSGEWNIICPGGSYNYCRVNATIPQNPIGGIYNLIAKVRFNTSKLGGIGNNLTGETRSYDKIKLNQTGIKLQEYEENEYVISEGSSVVYKVYVRNYGVLEAKDLQIRFNKGECTQLTVSRNTASGNINCSSSLGCTSSGAGSNSATDWKITLTGEGGFAQLAWTLSLGSGSITQSIYGCEASVQVITSHPHYDNITGISFSLLKPSQQQQAQQQQFVCASNLSCEDYQYCLAGACVNLNCPSGMIAKNHKCVPAEGKIEILNYTSKVYILQGSTNTTSVLVKNTGSLAYVVKLSATIGNESSINIKISPPSYNLSPTVSGIFTINFSTSSETPVGYYTVTIKAYATANESVYDTKTITLGVLPREETKTEINETLEELKNTFASLGEEFNKLPSSNEPNYTLANRTYNRLLNMIRDAEEKIKAGEYLDAKALLDEINSSLIQFREEIKSIGGGGAAFAFPSDMFTLVAIIIVFFVIGGFLVYLLLPPPKSGYHPTLGYVPKERTTFTYKLKNLLSKIKNIFSSMKKPAPKGQKTLTAFEKTEETIKEVPSKTLKQPETSSKGYYMEGYHRLGEFPLTYEKDKFKEKKK